MFTKLKKFTILMMIFSLLIITAQEEKSKKESQSKIAKLKGKIESIKIKTDKEEIELTGEEASEFFKIMKKFHVIKKHGKELFITSEDFDDHDIQIFKNKGKENFMWVTSDCDEEGTEKKVEIKVKKDGDGLEVTESTIVDGKETVKTYKGKEAEHFLQKNKTHNKHFIISSKGHRIKKEFIDDDEDNVHVFISKGKIDKNKILIELDEDCLDSLHKEIKIEIDGDDDENIIIKEKMLKDGKWHIKTFKGDEAKKMLKKHSHKHHSVHFFDHHGKCCEGKENILLNIEIDDNGEKILEVKTLKDGEENVQIFKGEAAEKYLKEHSDGHKDMITIHLDKSKCKKEKKIKKKLKIKK